MAPVTVLLMFHRLPTLTATQFRDYCENEHVPLVKSLLGRNHPLTHTRYYTNKESGFVRGAPSSSDPDCIGIITFESEGAMQESMRMRNSDGIKEKIEADEDKFMDRSMVQVVVLGDGDVWSTSRDSE